MLNRTDWLMLFLGAEGGPHRSDQVRVSRGMFLLSQIARHPLHGQYQFEAFEVGPVATGVFRDLDQLQLAGYLRVLRALGVRKVYELTDTGWERFAELSAQVPPEQLRQLEQIKRRATTGSLDELLNEIRTKFPEYSLAEVARAANG